VKTLKKLTLSSVLLILVIGIGFISKAGANQTGIEHSLLERGKSVFAQDCREEDKVDGRCETK
jgi:hypothetical protein